MLVTWRAIVAGIVRNRAEPVISYVHPVSHQTSYLMAEAEKPSVLASSRNCRTRAQ